MQLFLTFAQLPVHLGIFLLGIFLAFYIPGNLVIRRLQLSPYSKGILSILVGMVLWGWQGYVFGYMGMRYLTYVYLCIGLALWVYKGGRISLRLVRFQSIDFVLLSLFIIGVLLQSMQMAFNGVPLGSGILFCCGDASDNSFHMGLTRALIEHVPPFEPGLHGTLIKNYHYWGNLVVAEFVRIFKLPLVLTLFGFFSFFVSAMLGLTAIAFGAVWQLGKSYVRWLIFLLYFAGDAIYLLLLGTRQSLADLGKVSSLEDGSKFLVNPPRAFSIVIAFGGLTLLYEWLMRRNRYAGTVALFLFASTIGFKVYTGLFFAIGLVVVGVIFVIQKRWKDACILLLFYGYALIIYLPSNSGSGGLFFAPLSIVHDFMTQPAFGLLSLELARYVFVEHHNIPRILLNNIQQITIFLFAICGVKLFGIFPAKPVREKLGIHMNALLVSALIGSLVLGMFFLQSSGGANTFNFIVSFLLFGSIYAASWLDVLSHTVGKRLAGLFSIVLVCLIVPRVIQSSIDVISTLLLPRDRIIKNEELSLMNYISQNVSNDEIVIVDEHHRLDRMSPFFYALTGKKMYMSGVQILESHGFHLESPKLIHNTIFHSSSVKSVAYALDEADIDYVYFMPQHTFAATESAWFTTIVYKDPIAGSLSQVQKSALAAYLDEIEVK